MNSQAATASIHLREQSVERPRVFSSTDTAFLSAAGFSLVLSVVLWFSLGQSYGIFVGLWVPSIIGLWTGLKLVALGRVLTRQE